MKATKVTSRFDGAVHDEALVDAGANRQGEEVARIDLTYTRGPAKSSTTMILTLDAATTLRDELNRLLDDGDTADAADDSSGLVDEKDACPHCRERHQDRLVWIENSSVDNELQCETCGQVYRIEHRPKE